MISTKTGDKGTTKVFDTRISKGSLRVEAYGSIDELISEIALANFYLLQLEANEYVDTLMDTLRVIIRELAVKDVKQITELDVTTLESKIAEMNHLKIKLFVRPSGNIQFLHLNKVRTLTRRVERNIVRLNEVEDLNPYTLQFMNRLSDYFFYLSHYYKQLSE